ncbi:pilus assembly protein [Phaeovulum sp.]|jgi:multidrug transporter EmrE-like cation transporter|uniref:pilus assembly protein n=1 Tax=Phaeovulum sp. TaxID=2934796 RepID=UPI002732187A|nr:pilus assembly protein [Phaeovulum sp.]MDP1668042.1 pilus assembly protein [Phaeovulum sp.]MDP2064108.1 pilus assembly protein [Phaeovulum sp.]MDP3860246.1 pilus assembly protein [Phaeovulum sp.]MDZ4119491.1 pilus assembly protein [Phaeovulum sp.]
MSMKKRIRSLWHHVEGAVTVDWVVLTAVVSGLGMAVAYTIWVEIGTANNNIVVFMDDQSIKTAF